VWTLWYAISLRDKTILMEEGAMSRRKGLHSWDAGALSQPSEHQRVAGNSAELVKKHLVSFFVDMA
jgi:hypothetical protein